LTASVAETRLGLVDRRERGSRAKYSFDEEGKEIDEKIIRPRNESSSVFGIAGNIYRVRLKAEIGAIFVACNTYAAKNQLRSR